MSLINRIVDECEILKNEENNIYAESMNKYHINRNLINHPKLLIVGTLTPPQGRGYHYTSDRNKMYEYLDCGLGIDCLESLKNKLQGYPIANETSDTGSYRNGMHRDDEALKIIKDIETILEKKGILLLDVVDKVLRRDEYSASDGKIVKCTLDYYSFEKINGADYVIVNSKDAYECFYEIMNRVGENNFPKIICLPQNPRRFLRTNRGKFEEGRYEDIWCRVIKYCLNGEELPNELETLCVVKKDGIEIREEWPPFGTRIINNVAKNNNYI